MKPKNKPESQKKNEKKSTADEELGGQPENDKDARDLGFKSATSGSTPKREPAPRKE